MENIKSVLELNEERDILEIALNGRTHEELAEYIVENHGDIITYEEALENIKAYEKGKREIREIVHGTIIMEAQYYSPFPEERELQEIRKRNEEI